VNNGATWEPSIADSAVTVSGTNNTTSWSIPDVISSTCKVRVSTTDGWQNVSAESGTFKIKGKLQIGYPAGGEVFIVTQNPTITGTKSTAVKKIRIDVWYDKDASPDWIPLVDDYEVSTGTTTWSYSGWTIPDKISPNTTTPKAKIRITDKTDYPNIVLQSLADNLKIIGAINLTVEGSSPSEYTPWLVGSSQDITWTAKGTVPVNIYYSPDGIIWRLIKDGLNVAGGSGVKTWNWESVRDEVSAGDAARIRIMDSRDEQVVSGTSAAFRVKGELTLTYPPTTVDEIFRVSQSKNIKWTSTADSITNVKLYYVIDNSVESDPFATVGSVKSSNNTYSWIVPDNKISDNVKIRVVAVIDSDVKSTGNSFKIKPDIKVTSPGGASGEIYTVQQSIPINWVCSGTQPSAVNIFYDKNDNNWVQIYTNHSNVTGTNTASPQWTIPNGALGSNVRVRVKHPSDEEAVSSTSTYTFKVKGDFTGIQFAGGLTEVEVGTNPQILWTPVGPISKVHIKYFKNNWEDVQNITDPATPTDNTGSYTSWVVPDNISTAQIYKIAIIDSTDPSVSNTSDVAFKIKGRFNVLSPNGGLWIVGESKTMSWTTYGNMTSVNLQAVGRPCMPGWQIPRTGQRVRT